jgi:thiol-disulfide isomerase/thioredoxin
MKTRCTDVLLAIAALAASVTLSHAAEATLNVGDPAPKLRVAKWVQGDPVAEFDKDHAYIVEFWATWCGPCRVSIPHLNELHAKFKDQGLVVIGQNCWERDESLVEPFIRKMGDKMTYRVAMDDKSSDKQGAMARTWMDAAGQTGIPTAFVVNKQAQIAWIGHPMELKDELIAQVLAGKYDVKKAAAAYQERQASQARMVKLSQQLDQEMQGKQWDKAEATLGELAKVVPEHQHSGLDSARFQILLGKDDLDGATKLATKLSAQYKDNAMMQNQLAWGLITREGIKGSALDLAATIANRANDASSGQDPGVLDTLARVNFVQGNKAKALELQEKAVNLAEGDLKDQLQKTLDSYKDGKLPQAD